MDIVFSVEYIILLFQLNNFKNFDDGVIGRILSYNDLSDRKTSDDKEKKENSDDDSEDEEEQEKKRKQEEEARKKREAEEEEERIRIQLEEEEERIRQELEEEEKVTPFSIFLWLKFLHFRLVNKEKTRKQMLLEIFSKKWTRKVEEEADDKALIQVSFLYNLQFSNIFVSFVWGKNDYLILATQLQCSLNLELCSIESCTFVNWVNIGFICYI